MCLDSTYSSQDKVSLLYHRKANICQHDYWSRIILAWVMKKTAYHLWFVVSCSSKNHAPHFLSKVYLQIVVFYWYWVKYITISLGSWLYIYNCTVVVKQGQLELLFRQAAISCQSSWGRCQTTIDKTFGAKRHRLSSLCGFILCTLQYTSYWFIQLTTAQRKKFLLWWSHKVKA